MLDERVDRAGIRLEDAPVNEAARVSGPAPLAADDLGAALPGHHRITLPHRHASPD